MRVLLRVCVNTIPQQTYLVNTKMPISLRFNGEQFYSDLRERLVMAMDEINSEFFRAATSGMSQEAKADSAKDRAVVEKETDYKGDLGHDGMDTEFINARAHFYADAILESFGIGSLADRGPFSQWEEYATKKNPLFNPLRVGKMNIVGRKAGEYTNIWGEKVTSKGGKAGQNLESKTGAPRVWFDKDGTRHELAPKRGTYAIQNVEQWLMQDRETSMERRIRTEVEKFILEMSENPMKYFYYVDA